MRSRIASQPRDTAKEAVLTYRVLERKKGSSLLEIEPKTGRHHQIRLQLADLGHPIIGDIKYGAGEALPDKSIALHAGRLAVKHPTRDVIVELVAPPPLTGPWLAYAATIEAHFAANG
jgi:23S rRNA pseudouridine1911/1915/1917 synthase